MTGFPNHNSPQRITLLLILYVLLMPTVAKAAECLPSLGNGNICTANDFELTETLVTGPPSCVEGEIIPQSITLRVGMIPNAKERYDIGIFIGNEGGSPVEGESCTFASLIPIEGSAPFDGSSGHGPYRNLDGNQCGDTLKTDGSIYRNITLNDVLCRDSNNDGKLDISYAVTWQNNVQSCDDPNDPSLFYPETSSKCILDAGNISGIDVLPPVVTPSIKVTKTAIPGVIEAPGSTVTYAIQIENTGTEAVDLTNLNDDVIGDVNGLGDCSLPQQLEPQITYQCQLDAQVNGNAGDTVTNTVTASARDADGTVVNDTASATVTIISAAQPSASIGQLVWNDLNGNHFHDQNEPGIPNATISLQRDDGSGYTNIEVTKTNLAGQYEFSNLPEGSYRVIPDTVSAPLNSRILTSGINPHDVDLKADEHYQNANFGFAKARINVFKNVNKHVIYAPSSQVTYSIVVLNTGGVNLILEQLVDDRFGDLSSRNCRLPKILAHGEYYSCQFTETISGQPGDVEKDTVTALALDQDQNAVTASDSAVVLLMDPAKSSIGHLVWNDQNANGVYDNGEPFFEDITLSLSGEASETTSTANGGQYTFANLSSGSYTVTVTDTSGFLNQYVLTTHNQPYQKNLSAGQTDTEANFGYAKAQVVISKTANKTEIYAPGENVDFTVVIRNPGSVDLNITNRVDNRFGNLNATCGLPTSLSAGNQITCDFSENIAGNAGDVHNDVVTVTALDVDNNSFTASDSESISIVANAGGGLIGRLVWDDINGNGKKDLFEPGIDGVTFDLVENNNVVVGTASENGGRYRFDVPNGTYAVKVTDVNQVLSGKVLSGGSNPHTGIVINDDLYISANFGYANPGTRPSITLTKTADTQTIEGSKTVTFYVTVTNSGTTDVTIDKLSDTAFGSLDGQGTCSAGVALSAGENYECSFSKTLSGQEGDMHRNIAFAVARDDQRQIVLGADSWEIDFVANNQIPALSTWGFALLLIALSVTSIWRNRKKRR